MWLGAKRGHAVDWVTQRWVQLTGRRIAVEAAPWLDGPCGSTHGIGDEFFERWGASRGLTALAPRSDDGLLDGLEPLRGPTFDPSAVHPILHDFYARTAAFDLSIESRWSWPFRPVGWLVARLFARRLAQLNMPLSDRDLRGGVESRIVRLADEQGVVRLTAWVRTAVERGQPLFVGRYGTTTLDSVGPCVQVVFPLPNGNAIVLLRPRAEPGGGLSLISDGHRFGDPGFYFTVDAGGGERWARRVGTMKERLQLNVHDDGRTILGRHRFRVFGLPFLELGYRITG